MQLTPEASLFFVVIILWIMIGSIVVAKGICKPTSYTVYIDEEEQFISYAMFIFFNIILWPIYVVIRFIKS